MGVTGILWFFIYERTLDGNFRVPPVDLFWERTETFSWLSRQNRTFMRFHAPLLEDSEYDKTYALDIPYADLPLFDGGYGIEKVERVVNGEAPLILTHFKGKQERLVLVNADRNYPVRVRITFSKECAFKSFDTWMAPGQMNVI